MILFFGKFNKNCLYKFISLHGDPLKDQPPKQKLKLKFSKEAEKENEAPILKAKKHCIPETQFGFRIETSI